MSEDKKRGSRLSDKRKSKGDDGGEEGSRARPFDPISEQIVVGAALRGDTGILSTFTVDDCYAQRHRIILSVLKEMTRVGLSYDVPTFVRLAGDMDYAPADYGKDSYLRDLVEAIPESANLEYHVDAARREARLRRVADEEAEGLLEELRRPSADVSVVRARVRRISSVVGSLDGAASTMGIVDGEEAYSEYMNILRLRQSGSPDFVPTGLPELDSKLTYGWAPEKVTVFASRPSNGKSATSYNFLKWWADRMIRGESQDPRPALALALEMGRISAQDGLIARAAKVDVMKIVKTPEALTIGEKAAIAQAAQTYLRSPWIHWYDKPASDVDRIEEVLASREEVYTGSDGKQSTRTAYGLVVWDLFDKSITDQNNATIAQALNKAQTIAKKYHTHLLLLAQIKRGVEKRGDKRPTREDVKGSGGWEEVADQIITAHREKVYDPEAEEDLYEMGILKQRLGPFGQWMTFEYEAPYFYIGKCVDET